MSASRLARLALCLGVLAACDAPLIPGRDAEDVYDFTLPTDPPLVLHWPDGAEVRVFVVPSPDATRSALLREAFDAGAAAWNREARFAEYRLVRVADVGAADVVLTWSDVILPVDASQCRPAITRAVTTFCLAGDTGSPRRLVVFPLLDESGAGTVKMLVTVLASEAADAEQVHRLVAHELGHVLGIARHSPDASDLMWGTDLATSRPSARDAATVQLLYHLEAEVTP